VTFRRTALPEIVMIEPEIHGDDRGYFMETFRLDRLEAFLGHCVDFVQENESLSSCGVLRGLHYQVPPHAQSKLVRMISGRVLDVAVDIRRGSPTFGQHIAVELSYENRRQLFIPRGFAHGFVVLSSEALFAYKVDSYYALESERGIAFDDPALGIDWQLDASYIQLSPKDAEQPLLEAAELFEYGSDLYA